MPVIPINTPNLATDIAQIDTFIATILGNAPTTLNSFINPCWGLKPTGDCGALILTDFTDYQELTTIDLNDVLISVNFGMLSACNCEVLTDDCLSGVLLPNSITSYPELQYDGTYCAEVTIQYTDNTDPQNPIVYTEVIKVTYDIDCCEKKYRELSYNIWGKMSDISCTINCLVKVGRNVKTLKKSYLQLSNLLWLYYHSKDSCEERDKVFCIFNKIK